MLLTQIKLLKDIALNCLYLRRTNFNISNILTHIFVCFKNISKFKVRYSVLFFRNHLSKLYKGKANFANWSHFLILQLQKKYTTFIKLIDYCDLFSIFAYLICLNVCHKALMKINSCMAYGKANRSRENIDLSPQRQHYILKSCGLLTSHTAVIWLCLSNLWVPPYSKYFVFL